VPSDRAIDLALMWLTQKGFSVNWMDARFKELGVTMRKRQGKVRDWLESLSPPELAALVERLKEYKNP
jgi:hypothetical protein